ncbi:acyl-CoA dehydrogenase family protein, partial [Streptomyces asiaticus]|uniref:acyl-CoA dehydrogenase family protein n=1 Tax=Streptomyces asiaticus TaxID=114695 RepID=UPI003F67140D
FLLRAPASLPAQELTRQIAASGGTSTWIERADAHDLVDTDEQKRRWLPGFCSGETITAIAMTEPGAGSDLQAIRTTAEDKGDHWLLNGSKTFISNGILADLVIVVAKTTPDGGAKGLSLIVVERGAEGFERGRNLDKIGQKSQDTA